MIYTLDDLNIASIFLLRGFISGKTSSMIVISGLIGEIIDVLKNRGFYEDRVYIIFYAIGMLSESTFESEFKSILREKNYSAERILELNKFAKSVAHALENC